MTYGRLAMVVAGVVAAGLWLLVPFRAEVEGGPTVASCSTPLVSVEMEGDGGDSSTCSSRAFPRLMLGLTLGVLSGLALVAAWELAQAWRLFALAGALVVAGLLALPVTSWVPALAALACGVLAVVAARRWRRRASRAR